MRVLRYFCFLIAVFALLAADSRAEVLQSKIGKGGLWLVRDGASTRLGGSGDEIRVTLPAGTTLNDLEPIRQGWLAAGRLSSGEGTDLLIITGDRDGSDLLEVPARGPGRYRGQPRLVIDRGDLAGLVWLEGNGARELEVWAAVWDGEKWQSPELVSSKGPGSQVTPAVTVLDDGTWLLIWAAFDGMDHEIMWSRRSGGAWSRPRRVHPENDVPDITPDVVAIENGAVAVWSGFDGNDYRLRLSRFSGGAWDEPMAFGGRGSVDPDLTQIDGGAWVLFQTVETSSWSLLALDESGSVSRMATVFENTYDRPLVLIDRDGNARFRWPGVESTGQAPVEYGPGWQDLP